MFENPSFFLSLHAFIVGLAAMSISRKHAHALSSQYGDDAFNDRLKQFNYFFNISMIAGAISLLIILSYVAIYGAADPNGLVDLHQLFKTISIAEIFFLFLTLILSFGGGLIAQLIGVLGS